MTCRSFPGVRTAIAAAAVLVSSGWASTATPSGDPDDSWESANRNFYAFNDAIDRAVLAPAAHLYLRLPADLRTSVHNFFDNAAYPGTVLNQLLQGKFEPAMEGSARFVFNTTLGIGGLFDVATRFGLEREEEDCGGCSSSMTAIRRSKNAARTPTMVSPNISPIDVSPGRLSNRHIERAIVERG